MTEVIKAIAIAGPVLAGIVLLSWVLRKRQWFVVWVRRPFQFFAISAAVWLFFHFADIPSLEKYAAAVVIATAVGGLVHVVVSFMFGVFFSRQRDIHLPPLLRNVILASTYVLIFVVALKAVVPDFSLSPLLVASGVLSLVLGLAFQDVLSNLIAGVTLSVERPLRTDDWVTIGGKEGKVVEITWRTTKILTRNNDYVILPNRLVAENDLWNYSYPSSLHRAILEIGLPYSTLPTIAEQALLEAARKTTGVLRSPRPLVLLSSFDDFAITYKLVVSIEDYDSYFLILSDVRKEIFYCLKRYNVVIPFPVRTVQMHQGEPASTEWKEPHHHRLHVLSGRRRGEFFPLSEEAVLIGRGGTTGIDLRDPVVSKDHAQILFEKGEYFIQDSGSKHGTLVNGSPVEKRKLRSGDEITIGDSVLRFEMIEFG